MFERVAACLGNVQCLKKIVNDYDVLVSTISNFERRNISVYEIVLECTIVIFEKLIVSLIIPVDEQLLIAFLLWVLITYVTNRAQTYYKTLNHLLLIRSRSKVIEGSCLS